MADDQSTNGGARNVGRILEIQGVVVDAVFPDELPEINTALKIVVPEREGRPAIELVAEVQQHLGDDRVRAVAMDSTDGIPRGVEVFDTGAPISVPVGDGTLGRIFNVARRPDRPSRPGGRGGRALVDPPRSARVSTSSARRRRSSRPGSRSST